MNEAIKVLLERRSIRKYKPEQITDAELNAVLDAGMYAPSAKNQQPVIMVAVQDPETVTALSRMNAAVLGTPDKDPFYGAPTVIVVLADTSRPTWIEDGSLVMGNLMNAAWAVGIGSCWINRAKELFDMPEGKALLRKWGLPETLRGVGNCILGYIDGEVPVPKPRKADYIVRV